MSVAHKVKVTIFGEPYTLVTDESEDSIRTTVALVDQLMHEMAKRMGNVEARKIAVFVALQLASKNLESQRLWQGKMQHLIDQIDHNLQPDIQ